MYQLASGAELFPALDLPHPAPARSMRPRRHGPARSRHDKEGTPMSNFDPNYAAARRGVGADRAIAVDAGLRAYMIRVYNYMAAGVALTGVVAWLTYQMAGGDAIVIAGSRISGLTPLGQLIFNPVTTI